MQELIETMTKCPKCEGTGWKVKPVFPSGKIDGRKFYMWTPGTGCRLCYGTDEKQGLGSVTGTVCRAWLSAQITNQAQL